MSGEDFSGRTELVAGGGGFLITLPKRVTLLASTELEVPSGHRQYLVGAIVARRDRRWSFHNPWRMPPMPAWPASPGAVAGTVGPTWVRFEPLARIAWVGVERYDVPGDGNVLLLHLHSRGDRAAEVAGTVRVHAEFPTTLFTAGRQGSRAARAEVKRVTDALLAPPEVRQFIDA